DDFDHDGYEAMGHGGDDCDDTTATIAPVDLDGDGLDPCDGDCDEGDPNRNADATPICGNGGDDDCDNASDCAQGGILGLDGFARWAASTSVGGAGTVRGLVGDPNGDGVADLALTATTDTDAHRALVLPIQPFPAGSDESIAWAEIDTTTHPTVGPAGDVD